MQTRIRSTKVPFMAASRWVLSTLLIALVAAGCSTAPAPTETGSASLRQVAEIGLTGGPGRFDYQSLDTPRGLLFIAHMGAGEVIEVDVHSRQVVRTVGGLEDVHGVLVVPERHRLYATVTARDEMATIDEDTGEVLHTSATGTYPDGLAYDPVRGAVWTTNEHEGTESVIDADTGTGRGTVELGGEVGNVVFEPGPGRMVVAVQGRDELAEVDPTTLKVVDRIPTPGCRSPHGEALDAAESVMFVGCEDNATMIAVDLNQKTVTAQQEVGRTPDVLTYDDSAHRLYVASESGWVGVFDHRDRNLTALVSHLLAEAAHTVAVDPTTHHSFFPLPHGNDGPVLREYELAE